MSKQIFSLEVLNAFHGDCLLLHYGDADEPGLILIDGGPGGVFDGVLAPRLKAIREARNLQTLMLDHVIVTHLDSDHITGVIELAENIYAGESEFDAYNFWFNNFDDTLTVLPDALLAAATELRPASLTGDSRQASIDEGRALRDWTNLLKANVNNGADLLMADGAALDLDLSPKLVIKLVCPSKVHLRKLADKWIAAKKEDSEKAAYLDQSVFNLSSLVMVVETSKTMGETKSILLTGDARGDHVLAGLADGGLLDGKGRAHFDVVKVPHHGSERNAAPEFFRDITAQHYVISGDGRYENPSIEVLEWIANSSPPESLIWLTYDENKAFPGLKRTMARFVEMHPEMRDRLRVRRADEASFTVDLLAPLTD